MRRYVSAIVFAICCTCAAPVFAQVARTMTLDDLWSIRTIGRVQIAPDGKRILFSVTPATGEGADELKIFDVATGRTDDVVFGESYYTHRQSKDIVWSRSGDALLFMKTEPDKISLWRWDLATKTSSMLFAHEAPSINVAQYLESPDGRRFAFVCVSGAAKAGDDERKRAITTTGLVLGEDNGRRYAPQTSNEVWIWDRGTGKKESVWTGRLVTGMAWSPDSSKLALQSFVERRVVYYAMFGGGGESGQGITVLDLARGRRQTLRDIDLQGEWILDWSPDGRSLAVDTVALIEAASSPNGLLGLSKGRHATEWTLDAATGELRTTGGPLFVEDPADHRSLSFTSSGWFHWHKNGVIYYKDTIGNRTAVIAGATPGAVGRTVSEPRWNLSKVSFAGQAEVAAAVRETANEPPELALVDLRTGAVKTLTSINAHMAALRHQQVEPFRVTNRFGYATDNWLIKPPDYDPGKKYPLVILLYNFNNAFAAHPWMKNFAPFEYARLGTVVLLANYPVYDGAPGEGRQSIQEKWRFGLGVNPLASFEAAVDRLTADGLVDPRRVAIAGFSYGGFLTQYAITHSSKFSVAFVNDGGAWNPNFYYFSGIRDSTNLMMYDFMFGGAPYGSGHQAMREFLPAYGLGGLPIPILFEGHGGEEAIPAFADVYLTARQEGTPIETIVYKDSHILTGRERQHSSIRRSTDWLRYWLLDEENPDPLDKEQYARWAELRRKLEILKARPVSRR